MATFSTLKTWTSRAALCVVAGHVLSAPVHAAPLNASEVLNQFNLVTLGNASVYSHVDGRSFIAGSLDGHGAVFAMNGSGMPASSGGYAGLTVLGQASGLHVNAGGLTVLGNLNQSIVNNGAAVVGGNASDVNFNGNGGSYVYGTKTNVNSNSGQLNLALADAQKAAATGTSFASVLQGASNGFKSLADTGSSVTVQGNKATFNAVAVNGVAVFNLTDAEEAALSLGEFEFNLNGATSVIINTDMAAASIGANFLGGSAQAIGGKTLWNFYNASSLTLNAQFGGQVLATHAALTNNQNIEGGVFVDSLIQHGEIHLQPYTGITTPVPEPTSLALMLAGLGALSLRARRRA